MERLNGAWVVVRFDLKGNTITFSDIDHTGIFFTRRNKHSTATARECLELQDGVFVGAVFTPHHRIHAEFRVGWCATQFVADQIELRVGESKFACRLGGHRDLADRCGISHGMVVVVYVVLLL